MEKTMKKTLTMAAIVCLAALAVSCGNKKRVEPAVAIEAYTDSIYMVNDSTIGDLQTYIYIYTVDITQTKSSEFESVLVRGINREPLRHSEFREK